MVAGGGGAGGLGGGGSWRRVGCLGGGVREREDDLGGGTRRGAGSLGDGLSRVFFTSSTLDFFSILLSSLSSLTLMSFKGWGSTRGAYHRSRGRLRGGSCGRERRGVMAMDLRLGGASG